MRPLYVSSISTFSGKTAICLGLGLRMQESGFKVGYLKPVSTQPWHLDGKILDQDADFVRRILSLEQEAWELSPVVITDQLLDQLMKGELDRDLIGDIRAAYDKVGHSKDILIMEGGANLREGTALGVRSVEVAREFDASVLMVIRWENMLSAVDGALNAKHRYAQMEKDLMVGVIINNVPEHYEAIARESVVPFLESRGVPVFGVIPQRKQLMAISVGELVEILSAEVLTHTDKSDELAENLLVGAMSVDQALPRFRRYINKAVITGGDRSDIQLAALETSTVVLILTGNLRPSPAVVAQAEDAGVAVLLVPTDTMTTVEAIEEVFGKTRLGQAEKLNRFQALLAEHLNYDRLIKVLEL
ncbi:MAG: phosphotransacetylase family protein [Anaerolineae bacterium]|nr:phosphotransacetylase family protein [Anaerolineae bacterium]